MSKFNSNLAAVAVIVAMTGAWRPALAEVALDHGSGRQIEWQLPDFGKPNRSRSSGATLLVSRAEIQSDILLSHHSSMRH